MDNIEGSLWLATQLRLPFAIHLWAAHAGFAPKRFVVVTGMNEFKIQFLVLYYLTVWLYIRTTIYVSVGG